MMHNAHLTAHTFIGVGTHNALFPPSVVPVIAPHISIDTLLGLTLKAKYSKTVIGPYGFQFIGQDNDSGFLVPHFCIPPTNVLIPVIILLGGSKVMFTASTVQIDVDGAATPMACCLYPYVPLSLNQACNDPCNYPSDRVIAPNSVVVGMTLADFVIGIIRIGIDSAINYAAGRIADEAADQLLGTIGTKIAERMAREYVAELTERFGRETAESMGRDIVENLLERPVVQLVREFVEELVEDMEHEWLGDAVRPPSAPAGGADGHEIDSLTGAEGSNPRVFRAD